MKKNNLWVMVGFFVAIFNCCLFSADSTFENKVRDYWKKLTWCSRICIVESLDTILSDDFFADKHQQLIKELQKYIDLKQQDSSGATLLHDAAEHTNVIKFLIEAGLDVNKVDIINVSALHLAATNPSFISTAEVLLKAGANKHIRDDSGRGLTPEEVARVAGCIQLADFIRDWNQ